MRANYHKIVDRLTFNGYSNEEIDLYFNCTYGKLLHTLSEMDQIIDDLEIEEYDRMMIEDGGLVYPECYTGKYIPDFNLSYYLS